MKKHINRNIFGKKHSSLSDQIGNLFIYFCVYLVLMLLIFSMMYTAVLVDGTSMENTYKDGDILYYLSTDDITYGDVVIVEVYKGHEIVKRVIGLEGDKIGFDIINNNGTNIYQLTVNGKVVLEPYIKSIAGNSKTYYNMYGSSVDSLIKIQPEKFVQNGKKLEYVVGENEIFVLGDNRGVSIDSSYHSGAFNIKQVKGRVDFMVEKDNNVLFSLLKDFFWPF